MSARSYRWHLEQAAIHQQIADQCARRGFHHAAVRASENASQHRKEAQRLALKATA